MTLPIVLASASPRRAFLLKSAGIPFETVQPGQVEGKPGRPSDPRELAKALARAKAKSVATGSDRIFLGCDTLVAVDKTILGKPASPSDARRMLKILSGRWHRVITGVCVLDPRSGRSFWIARRQESVSRGLGQMRSRPTLHRASRSTRRAHTACRAVRLHSWSVLKDRWTM